VYPPASPADAAERVADLYHGRVLAGWDGMRITLGEGLPSVDPK
jgi:hypothetical protein